MFDRSRWLNKWSVYGCLFTATALVWWIVWRETRPDLTVAFLDIGQGDATLIEWPAGCQVLIDGSAGRQILRALARVLPFYDRSIDALIATHPDADHIAGLIDVVAQFKIKNFLEPGVVVKKSFNQTLHDVVAGQGVPLTLARRGMRLRCGTDGAVLTILFPDQDVSNWDTNDASIVARLDYQNHSFLFTGDSTMPTENYLIIRRGGPPQLKSEVLKVGHHGSKTSTGDAYLEQVAPTIAVISVGAKNRYGHPHPSVLERLTKFGTKIFRTDQDGTIIFQVRDGKLNQQKLAAF